jgi:hypothetical protein
VGGDDKEIIVVDDGSNKFSELGQIQRDANIDTE